MGFRTLVCLTVFCWICEAAVKTAGGPANPLGLRGRSITQFGITWAFDTAHEYGTFVNGDFWVVGPVSIVRIDPPSINGRNGSMVNPSVADNPFGTKQGYDNRISWANCYDSTLNVAVGVSEKRPLRLEPGTSLVSTISWDTPPRRPILRCAAILTVLGKSPPPGSFRPAFASPDKAIRYTLSRVDTAKLSRLPLAGSFVRPSESLEAYFEKPWIDHAGSGPMGQFMHPQENLPNYGREVSLQVGEAALFLCLDLPCSVKEKLLIRFLQTGIDLYGVATTGGGKKRWIGGGGMNSGRKWPILFAGIMFGDTSMQRIRASFQEDEQTYSGKGWTGATTLWSPNHISRPQDDYEEKFPSQWTVDGRGRSGDARAGSNSDIRAESYRLCCNSWTWVGYGLAAEIMGAEAIWNHPPFFSYVDRIMTERCAACADTIEKHTGRRIRFNLQKQVSPFVQAMWGAYHK